MGTKGPVRGIDRCFWGVGREGGKGGVCVRGEGAAQGRGPGRDGVSEPVGRETAPDTAHGVALLDHVLEWLRIPPLKPLHAIGNWHLVRGVTPNGYGLAV